MLVCRDSALLPERLVQCARNPMNGHPFGGEPMKVTAPISDTMIFDAYLIRMERRRREPTSIQNYGYHARRFCDWCQANGFQPQSVRAAESLWRTG